MNEQKRGPEYSNTLDFSHFLMPLWTKLYALFITNASEWTTFPLYRVLWESRTQGHLPAVDVIRPETFPQDIPITHISTHIDFRGHVQVTACFLTHVNLWHVSQPRNSSSTQRRCVHEPGGVRVDEPAGTAARIASAQGGSIPRLKSGTRLAQPPGHGGGTACQVGYGPSIYFRCHSAVKCCLQGAVKKMEKQWYCGSHGAIDHEG